jgi:hypothetical protein
MLETHFSRAFVYRVEPVWHLLSKKYLAKVEQSLISPGGVAWGVIGMFATPPSTPRLTPPPTPRGWPYSADPKVSLPFAGCSTE